MKNIAIGPLIKKRFEECRQYDRTLTVASFAKQINLHRATVYKIFEQHSIDVYLLLQISAVLHYNFFAEIFETVDIPEPDKKITLEVTLSLSQIQLLQLSPGSFRLIKSDDCS